MTESYKFLSKPPQWALKEIQAGRLKGRADINPQWRYEAMNDTFGECGIGWRYEVEKLWTEQGANGEVGAFALVNVFIKDRETSDWSKPIVGVGGSMLVANEKSGARTNDEAFKMATTDALSVALKFLGVAADIYKGSWDGSKYTDVKIVEKSEFDSLQQALIDYENIGVITGQMAAKARFYIAQKDIEGMKRTVNYCKEQTKQGA